MWPAVVLDESASSNLKGLNKISGEKSFLVQFFCTHDFARLAFHYLLITCICVGSSVGKVLRGKFVWLI